MSSRGHTLSAHIYVRSRWHKHELIRNMLCTTRPTDNGRDLALLDAWFAIAAELLQSWDPWLLGGWVRVWLNHPLEIRALAGCCKAYRPFLKPVCQLCGRMWAYREYFSSAHWMGMCRNRIVQANACSDCHKRVPVLSPVPVENGVPLRFAARECCLWQRICLKCGWQYTDRWVHDSYICSHSRPARAAVDSSSDTGSDEWEDPFELYSPRSR